MLINRHAVKIKKNECLIIFPGVLHDFYLERNQGCRLMNIHFRMGDISDFFNLANLQDSILFLYEAVTNRRSFFRLVDNAIIKNVSERIVFAANNPSEYSDSLIKLYFCELYIYLSRFLKESSSLFSRPLNPIKYNVLQYLSSFYNEKLTLDVIAKKAGISARHLTRLFMRETGISVQDYINTLRIRKAKELLEDTKLDITCIALDLGFGSPQYFTSYFRKSEGLTPKKYREMVKRKFEPHG